MSNILGLDAPWFTHPAQLIQLDNSFGLTAAIAEMLLPSHANGVDLLPALPGAWVEGLFRGLPAVVSRSMPSGIKAISSARHHHSGRILKVTGACGGSCAGTG